jgi:hypothetical protein
MIAGGQRRTEGGSHSDQIRRQDVKADLRVVAARHRDGVARWAVASHGTYRGKTAEIDGGRGLRE